MWFVALFMDVVWHYSWLWFVALFVVAVLALFVTGDVSFVHVNVNAIEMSPAILYKFDLITE